MCCARKYILLVKMPFSLQEKARILQEYHRNGSITTTQRWVRRVLVKTPPRREDILRWQAAFQNRGNLGHRGGNGRPRISRERIEEVRLLFQNDPRLSIRRASTALRMPQTTVHRILRRCLHLYPYRLQNIHLMRQTDRESRLQFAEYCQNHRDGYSEFLSKIVFTDECIFRLNGHVNTQNARIWGTERPTEGNQVPVHSQSVMFWCGISKEKIIGPYEIESTTVTGESYRNLLIRKVFPALTTLQNDFVFQQDGASPHRAARVRAYLNRKCNNYWIGRQGPVDWPARSPDLTPCDFFLWGYIKEKVYATPVSSLEELRNRIKDVCRRITPEILAKVWDNLKLRLNHLSRVDGGHIESFIS